MKRVFLVVGTGFANRQSLALYGAFTKKSDAKEREASLAKHSNNAAFHTVETMLDGAVDVRVIADARGELSSSAAPLAHHTVHVLLALTPRQDGTALLCGGVYSTELRARERLHFLQSELYIQLPGGGNNRMPSFEIHEWELNSDTTQGAAIWMSNGVDPYWSER